MTPNETTPIYQRRDLESLSDHYMRHLDAMTREGLHSKSDIAAELAWRDRELAAKAEELANAHEHASHWQRKAADKATDHLAALGEIDDLRESLATQAAAADGRRAALERVIGHLRDRDWFKEDFNPEVVTCGLSPLDVRAAIALLDGASPSPWRPVAEAPVLNSWTNQPHRCLVWSPRVGVQMGIAGVFQGEPFARADGFNGENWGFCMFSNLPTPPTTI